MCVSPIRVPTKKATPDFHPLIDRVYNYVPCGHCYQCLECKKNDYTVRSIFEHRDNLSKGGQTFFYTFTYNNDNVPQFKGNLIFNKRHLQLFLKRLRDKLSYPDLKYFITSEYGSNTHRPHYHALFFVKNVSAVDLYLAIKSSWAGYYGFIYPGRNLGKVENEDAIKYVAKYVNKDYALTKFIKDKYHNTRIDYEIKKYNDETGEKLDFKNFHLQSEEFGISLNNRLNYYTLVQGNIKVTTFTYDGSKKDETFPIPQYNKRKLTCTHEIVNSHGEHVLGYLKNSRGNVVYRLNDFGIRVQKRILFNRVEDDVLKFIDLRDRIDEFYDDSMLKFYLSKDSVIDLLYNIDFEELSAYKNFGRGLPTKTGFYKFSYKYFKHDVHQYYHFYKVGRFNLDYPDYKPFQDDDFDVALFCLNQLLGVLRYHKYLDDVRAYNSNQYQRYLSSGVYKPVDVLSLRQYCNMSLLGSSDEPQFLIKHCFYHKECELISSQKRDEQLFDELIILLNSTKTCLKDVDYNSCDLPFPYSDCQECPF